MDDKMKLKGEIFTGTMLEEMSEVPKCQRDDRRIQSGIIEQLKIKREAEKMQAFEFDSFTIHRMRNGNIWITDERTGEGGEFQTSDIEKSIEEFFKKNF
jgi:hypothetical protein